MASTYVSDITLLGHWEDILLGHRGKLACLWYDSLVLDTPNIQIPIDILIDRGTVSTHVGNELKRLWVPLDAVAPGLDARELFQTARERPDPTTSRLMDLGGEATRQHMAAELKLRSPKDVHPMDVEGGAIGLYELVRKWAHVRNHLQCVLMANDMESRFLKSLGLAEARDGFDAFRELARGRIPNLDGVPWEKILDLRYHPRLTAFRERIVALDDANSKHDVQSVAELVEEVFQRDLVELAQLLKPQVGLSAAIAFFSNLPAPWPMNPVSVVSGLGDYLRSRDASSRFGWLYFMLDLK
ncbi:MAG: hypothetical protein IT432_12170 [Phycisphaerales bacterium]|nr:hypothetical protein [Phycisphaerales bacterium]